MRPLRALVIYIVVVFWGSALLTPRVYRLGQTGAQTSPKPADTPFHNYVHRSGLILALAGLRPLLKAFGGWCHDFNWRLGCVVLLLTLVVVPRLPAANDKPSAA